LLTIALGILRGGKQEDDPYEPGTFRKRAYMRSLNFEKLVKQVNIELLDDVVVKEEEDLDSLDAAI
jgi:hypothetical protein